MATDEPMMASVAGRYASALFELATEQKQVAEVEGDLNRFQAMLDGSPDLQRLVRSPVFFADAQLKAGAFLLMAGRFEDAKGRAELLLQSHPTNADGQILLGNALAGLKDLDGAVAEIEEAIRLDPAQASTYSNLGVLQFSRGNEAEAEAAFEKAVALVDHFRPFETFALRGISAMPYAGLAGREFDLVINATSAGLSGEMPPLPAGIFFRDALAYDMVYGRSTPFLQFAAEEGARTADGTGMLVEQAAESFFLWRGIRPESAPVIAQLRRAS